MAKYVVFKSGQHATVKYSRTRNIRTATNVPSLGMERKDKGSERSITMTGKETTSSDMEQATPRIPTELLNSPATEQLKKDVCQLVEHVKSLETAFKYHLDAEQKQIEELKAILRAIPQTISQAL